MIVAVANKNGLETFFRPNALKEALCKEIEAMCGMPCRRNFGISFKRPNPQICHQPRKFKAALEAGLWIENSTPYVEDFTKPNSMEEQPGLQFDGDAIWYTDGSKKDSELGTGLTGAGVCCPGKSIELTIDPRGLEATNTINRAELAAIAVALKEMGMDKDETIATNSQVCLYLISKILDKPQDLQLCKHKEVLQDITDSLLMRAQAGRSTKDRKSTRLNSSHSGESRMPSSA